MYLKKNELSRRRFLQVAGTTGVLGANPISSEERFPGERVRVAMLGTGHAHARGKLQVLRQLREYELAGVCEPDEELRHKHRQTEVFAGVRWLELQELLEDKSIELVAIEGLVRENLAHAQHAIEAGKHIHLDKAPGTDLEKLDTLLKEAAKRELLVQMGYQWRYNPAFQAALAAAWQGWLGGLSTPRYRQFPNSGQKENGIGGLSRGDDV